jgi:hypothetical protein
LLSFAYVYFFESGFFNELQAIQIKNPTPSQALRRMSQAISHYFRRHAHKSSFDQEKVYEDLAEPPSICRLQAERVAKTVSVANVLSATWLKAPWFMG